MIKAVKTGVPDAISMARVLHYQTCGLLEIREAAFRSNFLLRHFNHD